jgi:hypothetical protein
VSSPSDGWQPERRLAVDEDHVVLGDGRLQHPLEGLLPGHLLDELHLGRGEIDVRGEEIHAGHVRRHDDLVDGDVALHQQVVDREVHLVRVEPQPDRQRALRVEVDEQHLAAELGQRGTEVDGGRGLAHAALLVAHGDHPGVAVDPDRSRLRDVRHRAPGGAEHDLADLLGDQLALLLGGRVGHVELVGGSITARGHRRQRGAAEGDGVAHAVGSFGWAVDGVRGTGGRPARERSRVGHQRRHLRCAAALESAPLELRGVS